MRGTRRQPFAELAEVDSSLDRLPPHSIEAEQGVLGCIFLSPHECMGQCIEQFHAGELVFYDLRNQTIYKLLAEMYDRKEAIDVITVQQRLKDKQQLEDVGGIAYIAPLPDAVPSAANLSFYVNIVREKYILRKMIATCTDAVSRVYEHEGEVDGLLDEVERDVLMIRHESKVEAQSDSIMSVVHSAIETLEHYDANKGMLMGLSSGFPDLDKMTAGFQNGDMIVIAARPSQGKTSLAMNIVEHVAIEQKLPVGMFSLEMNKKSLVMRMLCSRARVNLRNIQEGFMSERDYPKITSAAGKIAASMIHLDDSRGISIMQLRAKARRMWQQYGIRFLVIDYLQLLKSTTKKADFSRQVEVAEISAGVKELAGELNIPVLILSQLSREAEKQKQPTLANLKESGAIEQDADLVGLLYKGRDDNDDHFDSDAVATTLMIAKQRSGPTGPVNLMFLKRYTRFESAAKIRSEDVPEQQKLFRNGK